MAVVATGANAIAIDKLAHLVALSETFRAGRNWIDALSQSVEWWGRETSGEGVNQRLPERPFAVVEPAGGRSFTSYAGGDSDYFVSQGHLWLYLETAWDPAYYDDAHNALNVAANWFDAVIEEIIGRAGMNIQPLVGKVWEDNSDCLTILTATQGPIMRSDPDDYQNADRFWSTEFDVTWGIDA